MHASFTLENISPFHIDLFNLGYLGENRPKKSWNTLYEYFIKTLYKKLVHASLNNKF